MSAKYDLYANPNNPEVFHPRIVPWGTVSTDKLSRIISENTSFTEGDVKGVLVELSRQIKKYLSEGYHVELENLGFFSVSLQSRAVGDKNEIRSGSVKFRDINFRISKDAGRAMIPMPLERVPKKDNFIHSDEDRRTMLRRYLDKNSCITRVAYMKLTGLSRFKALEELKRLVGSQELREYGAGRTVVYTR